MSMYTLAVTLALIAPQSPDSSFASAPQGTPKVAREIRHIPIHGWVAHPRAPIEPLLGSFLATGDAGEPMMLLGGFETQEPRFDSGDVSVLVRQFTSVDWDDPDFSVDVTDSTVVVTGPADKVRQVDATVLELSRAFLRPITIRADLYRIPLDAQISATSSAAEADEMIRAAGMNRLWTSTVSCQSGSIASLAKERHTAYLHDVDVEVASGSKIADPQVANLFEGIRVAVQPHVLTDSTDMVLYAQVAFGEQRNPMVLRTIGNDAMPSLDVPDLNCTSGTMSGRIKNGGALVFSVQGESAGGGAMAVVIRATSAAEATNSSDLGIFPVSAMLSDALRSRVINETDILRNRECPLNIVKASDDGSRRLGPSDSDGMIDMISEAVGVGDSETESLEIHGGCLVFHGPTDKRNAVQQLVRGLQDQWLRTTEVELTTTLHSVHFEDSVFARSAPERDPQGTLHRLVFPALLGRSHIVIRGHESTSVRDIQVEIAQKSSISKPIVDRIFSGAIATVFAYPQQNGIGLETELDLLHTPALRHRVKETKDGGDLYLPTTNRARLAHNGPCKTDEPIALGEGPTVRIEDRSYRTRQTLRVRMR